MRREIRKYTGKTAGNGGIMDDLNEVRKVSEAAYRFLSRINPKDCQDGHYDLPDGVFANIQTYMPKPKSEGTFEAHRKYIDIQYIIERGRASARMVRAATSSCMKETIRARNTCWDQGTS